LIAGCPQSDTAAGKWPSSACPYQWFPLTDGTHAIASVSKTAPVYAHSYSGYGAADLIVACPKGANVTGGKCLDATGKDVSALIPKAQVAAFVLVAPPPPVPVPLDYTVTVEGAVPPVGAVFKQLDSSQSQCFAVSNGARTARVCL
jgi:hypothetical protein